jgi:ethanolamine utilization cobalamin adenosyltransferase
MIKLDVPYNWQVNNDTIVIKEQNINFKGTAQCGPTSACIMMSAFIPEAASDKFVKEFITDIDASWLQGKSSRKSAFQSNYETSINKFLQKYGVKRKAVVKPHGGTIDDIKKALNSGSPIMTSTKLTGDGHYICMVGLDEENKSFIFHDPYGKFDFFKKSYTEVKDFAGEYVSYPMDKMIQVMEESSKAANGPRVKGFRIIYLGEI